MNMKVELVLPSDPNNLLRWLSRQSQTSNNPLQLESNRGFLSLITMVTPSNIHIYQKGQNKMGKRKYSYKTKGQKYR